MTPTSKTPLRTSLIGLWLCLGLSSRPAFALSELFQLYTPTQGVSMGNALTADATGYLSNYYNPAGLAKASKRKYEIVPIDVEGTLGLEGLGRIFSAQGVGTYRLLNVMPAAANKYTYVSFSSVPAFSMRGFAFSLLTNYRFAGESDGTNIDMDTVIDIGPSIGFATNLFSNILKLGVTGKMLVRNQIKGVYALSSITDETALASLSKEGMGFGGDVGMMATLPYRWLPTIGATLQNVGNLNFTSESHLISSQASGLPDPITQQLNVGVSVHPNLARKLKATIAMEIRHGLENDIPLTKRLHLGVQVEDEKSFYIWAGLNQMYLTLGFALRLPGGNLEIGTYAADVAAGTDTQQDRRFTFRYTIGF